MAETAALPVVIVGSGLAGYTVAREFRKLDKLTPLVVVSRDHAGFYSKPMLSNALAGQQDRGHAGDEARREDGRGTAGDGARARARCGDRHGRADDHLASGETLAYRDLVLALGADPIRLPLEGDGASEVLSVNDLDDYARFADRLDGVQSVAILGGGLIGCEFANDLLARGIAPTVIDPAAWPLSRLLPPGRARGCANGSKPRARAFASASRRAGSSARGDGYTLVLTDGSRLDAGLVLSAIGLRPRTDLAHDAGLADQPRHRHRPPAGDSAAHVYAIGDCAEVDGHSLPYVMPIMQQARALAATLAGTPTAVIYPAMPVIVKTPACPTVVCPPPTDALRRVGGASRGRRAARPGSSPPTARCSASR